MEMFEQVWFWIATGVTVLVIPLVDSLLGELDPTSDRAKRWGMAKTILLRILPTRTTKSVKTGERKVSLPGMSAEHPDNKAVV
ncbi:MAG: hypothetical protein WBM40_08555 [Thiohalocapsa sp.]